MYLCICNAVKQGDTARYYLIGTSCGRCCKLEGEGETRCAKMAAAQKNVSV